MSRAQCGPLPPPVASTSRAALPAKRRAKALLAASTHEQSYEGEADGMATTVHGQESKKKRKKRTHVRELLVEPSTSSSSSSASSSPEPSEVGDGHDAGDMLDPRNLRANGQSRKRKQLRGLEFGMYHSALRDVAEGEVDLGRILYDWERVRRLREGMEREEEADRPPVDPTLDPSLVPAPGAHDARRLVNGERPSHQLPGSVLLTQLARWPLVSSLCPPGPAIEDSIESLQDVASLKYRELKVGGLLRTKGRKRLRSAYEGNAPLARPLKAPGSQSSNASFAPSDSEEEESALESADDDDLDLESDDPLVPLVLPLLEEILLRLAAYTPRVPFPAENPTAFKLRDDRTRRPEGVGWEQVWYAARDMGMSKDVTDKLRMRMEEVYGRAKLTPKRVSRKEPPPTTQALGYTFDSLMAASGPKSSARLARSTPSVSPTSLKASKARGSNRIRDKAVVRPPPRAMRKNEDPAEYLKNLEAEWVAEEVRLALKAREVRRKAKAENKGTLYFAQEEEDEEVAEGGLEARGLRGFKVGMRKAGVGDGDDVSEEEEVGDAPEGEVSAEESEESEDADDSD